MSTLLELPIGTLEYLNATATLDRGKTDPTTSEVEFALTATTASPTDDDWHPGEWAPGGPPYLARILVGPEQDIDSAAGTYMLWLRFTDNPEIPKRRVGRVKFF